MSIFSKKESAPVVHDLEQQYERHEIKFPQPVYYVESSDDESVLVAIEPKIIIDNEHKQYVEWYDTIKDRVFEIEESKKLGNDGFAFKNANVDSNESGFYLMTPMSVEIYNQEVKDKLMDSRDFNNIDEIIDAFLSTEDNLE